MDFEISHMCECTVFLQARGAIQLIKIVCPHAHRGTTVTLSIEICTCRFLYLDVIFVRSGDELQVPDRLQEKELRCLRWWVLTRLTAGRACADTQPGTAECVTRK